MPKFIYKAKSGSLSLIEGVLEAESRSAAAKKLDSMGYFPMTIETYAAENEYQGKRGLFQKTPGTGELTTLFRQLSELLSYGMTIFSALKMMSDQPLHPALRHALEDMTAGVREGRALSEGMEKHPNIFPPLYTRLVYAGETGGMLSKVLARIAEMAEKEDDIRSEIRSAMAYPIFISVVGAGTILFLLTVIIPRLAGMFEELRQTMPLPTRILLFVSESFQRGWWVLGFGSIALLFAAAKAGAGQKFKAAKDRALMTLPIVRSWALKREIGYFARTLGTLLENGVAIVHALDVSTRAVGNVFFQRRLAPLADKIKEGTRISSALRETGAFPAYVCNMVAVGEEGGNLDGALLRIADNYDRQAQKDLKMVVSLMEPALILLVGTVLGAIVISIMLPIFEINALIR